MPALKNARHEAFAQGLARRMPAASAYIAAGYKESRSAASRLSTKVHIQARVKELIEASADKAEMDIARALEEMRRLGVSDIRDAFTSDGRIKPPAEWSDDFAAAVSAVEVVSRGRAKGDDGEPEIEHVHKIKLWDKNSALEKIAKFLGMFVDRVQHTGVNGGPIQTIDLTRLTTKQLRDFRQLYSLATDSTGDDGRDSSG